MNYRTTVLTIVLLAVVLSGCSRVITAPPESGEGATREGEPTAALTSGESVQTGTAPCSRDTDGVRLLVNPVHGYCLRYPANYDIFIPNESEVMLFKRSVLNASDPRLMITVGPAGQISLEEAAKEIALQYAIPGTAPIQSSLTVGGEQAILLAGLSGQDPNWQLVVMHKGQLYRLFFVEVDKNNQELQSEFEALFDTVIESFNFRPESNPCPGCEPPQEDSDT